MKDACHVTKCRECDIPEPWREEFNKPKTDLIQQSSKNSSFIGEFMPEVQQRKDFKWNVEEVENEEHNSFVKLDIVEGYTGY